MTGGSLRFRIAEAFAGCAACGSRLEIDDLGMQRQQPRQDGVAQGQDGCLRLRRREPERRRCMAAGSSRRLHQHTDDAAHGLAHLVAVHHHVDHAMFQQIFGALEAFRQFFADGLLDHALAGKADQGAGLGNMDVAQHGIGGGDAAGGRMGQHDDIGQFAGAQFLHRDGGARQSASARGCLPACARRRRR